MRYTTKEKQKIIKGYIEGENISKYCSSVNISESTFYKWKKLFLEPTFIEIVDEKKIASSSISINVNNAIITVDSNYDESLLIKVINSLQKLW